MKSDTRSPAVNNNDKIEKRFEKKDTPHPRKTGATFFIGEANRPMLFLKIGLKICGFSTDWEESRWHHA
jgi:hypothetical protein